MPERGTLPDYNNWGARFGFAYALTADGKTSLRGGGGMFYDVQQLGEFNNDAVNAPPFSLRLSVVQPQGPFHDPYQGRDDFNKITRRRHRRPRMRLSRAPCWRRPLTTARKRRCSTTGT